MTTRASAPGKVILLGEHAAVYGNPVLVAAVDLRTYAIIEKRDDNTFILNNESTNVKDFKFHLSDIPKLKRRWNTVLTAEAIDKIFTYLNENSGLNIWINSEAPVSSGFGSSASAAASLVLSISKELGHELEMKEIANLAWDIENIVHGKSSGVDPFSVTYGGILRYKKGKFKKISVKEYPSITIGNTNIKSDTGKIVMDVMRLKDKFPKFFDKYLDIMIDIVDYGQKFLEKGDLKNFGEIMNINHGLLSSIGVSSPELDRLVWAARKKSSGAKLCGAGKGGIMIALGDVSKEIENVGGRVIKTKIVDEGIRIEFYNINKKRHLSSM